ncbi:MAG TPA: response regulator [Acidobacteriota bacterium]|nr:response regulator [Acidobacteriota bacterium]
MTDSLSASKAASIVLADDSTTIQKVVQLSFSDEPIDVRIFSDGKSALDDIRAHGADAVLVDISLPEIDGYELCRILRKELGLERVPLILLAGTFEPFDVERAEMAGYTGSLTKPFETSQLVSLVKELLQKEDSPGHVLASGAAGDRDSFSGGEDFLINPVPGPIEGELIFKLSPEECRPSFQLLEREIIGSVTLQDTFESQESLASEDSSSQTLDFSPEQLDQLVNRLSERLPDALRSILPEILRDTFRKAE